MLNTITDRERTARATSPTTGEIIFTLDAWPVPITAYLPQIEHTDILHNYGFWKTFYCAGKPYIGIVNGIAPIGGATDMGIVVIGDESGQICYQVIERSPEYQFSSHHIPAFVFLQVRKGAEVKPLSPTVWKDGDETYSIDAKAVKAWSQTRHTGWGTVTGVLWEHPNGTYTAQDYHAGRVVQSSTHGHISTALWHITHGGAPNPYQVPPLPSEYRDRQDKYNQSWIRQKYRINAPYGPPLISLHGAQNQFTYNNGVTLREFVAIYPDGREERPERLYEYSRAHGKWVNSAFLDAYIARKSGAKQDNAAQPIN